MAGAGNLGAASTNTGPGLSGNMGSVMGAGMGGMGFGGAPDSTMSDDFGRVTNAVGTASLGQMNDLLRGGATTFPAANSPMVSQPQAPSANDTITGYYQNILGRAPDQAGLDYWNKQATGGMSLDDIKTNFLRSNEYGSNPAAQQGYANYLAAQQAPQQPAQVRQPAPPVWKPTVAGVGNQPQMPVFNNNPMVTQSGGEGSGGAMNFQYRRGGIASLLKR